MIKSYCSTKRVTRGESLDREREGGYSVTLRSGRGRKCLPVSYSCPHCPREFNRKRHMELHVLFKHSNGETRLETDW